MQDSRGDALADIVPVIEPLPMWPYFQVQGMIIGGYDIHLGVATADRALSEVIMEIELSLRDTVLSLARRWCSS